MPIPCLDKWLDVFINIRGVIGSLQSLNKNNDIHKHEILAAVPDESYTLDCT